MSSAVAVWLLVEQVSKYVEMFKVRFFEAGSTEATDRQPSSHVLMWLCIALTAMAMAPFGSLASVHIAVRQA